jgi:hypothetical protein
MESVFVSIVAKTFVNSLLLSEIEFSIANLRRKAPKEQTPKG